MNVQRFKRYIKWRHEIVERKVGDVNDIYEFMHLDFECYMDGVEDEYEYMGQMIEPGEYFDQEDSDMYIKI